MLCLAKKLSYSAYHQIDTFFVFWQIFENCQIKTLLNSKILRDSYSFFIVTTFLSQLYGGSYHGRHCTSVFVAKSNDPPKNSNRIFNTKVC